MSSWKKALSMVLAVAMMLSLVPVNMYANAESGDTVTITWQWDDTNGSPASASKDVTVGESYSFDGALPTKDAGSEGEISLFTGWQDQDTGKTYYTAFPKAEKDTTYNAVFETRTRMCTVAFVNDDGTLLDSRTYAYGTSASAVTQPAKPTKAADARYSYKFAGWELTDGTATAVQAVTGDIVYRARYTKTVNTYTVTFVNADGATLATDKNVAYGDMATYGGAPSYAGESGYTYTFTGWKPALSVVTGDATYTATYLKTPNAPTDGDKYSYSFEAYMMNGGKETFESIASGKVKRGSTPTAPATDPTKAADERYTYTFAGWTPTISEATGDVTYVANYNAAERTYKVQWLYGETVLAEDNTGYAYDNLPAYDEATYGTPTMGATAENRYLFAGWKSGGVNGTIKQSAQFVAVKNEYPVVFLNDDYTVLQVALVASGTVPDGPAATPTKASDEQYTYTFAAWSPALEAVSGNATYTATYTPAVRIYTVSFYNYDDTLLASAEYPYGTLLSDMTQPAATKPNSGGKTYTHSGYTETDRDTVNGTITYQATFTETITNIKVIWKNYDGNILETDTVNEGTVTYGAMPEYNGATPTKPATAEYEYAFSGWEPTLVVVGDVAGDLYEYTAQYTQSPREYTVTWYNGTEKIWESKAAYGTTLTAADYKGPTPTKAADAAYTYAFDGWNESFEVIKGDVSYTAKFASSPVYYTVTYEYKAYEDLAGEPVEDGTLRTQTDATYTIMPDMDGVVPTMPATAEYTYEFKGWDSPLSAVTGNVTYTATFQAYPRYYTVKWIDGDGDTLKELKNQPYLATVQYDGDDPEKAADTANGKTFEWNETWSCQYVDPVDGGTVTGSPLGKNGSTKVKGDTTITAQFTDLYQILWLDEDGTTVLATTYEENGDTPSYPNSEPTKPDKDDGTETYEFAGWDPEIKKVNNAPQTYTAQFTTNYLITWVDGDGNTLKTEYVPEGVTPNYTDADPTKADDTTQNKHYTWTGNWDPTPYAADKAQTYTALFTDSDLTYPITWNYPDPDTGVDTTKTFPVPYNEDVTKPDAVPDYPTWVDKDTGKPFDPNNPTKPTKPTTYIPVFTITWDDPVDAYPAVQKTVNYQETVTRPTSELPVALKALGDDDWVEKDANTKTTFSEHPAYKDETWNPLYRVTWKYPNPADTTQPKTDDDEMKPGETLTAPADAPTVETWVNETDPNDTIQPGGKPTKYDATYVPIFTITWDDPNDTTDPVVKKVTYNPDPTDKNVKKPTSELPKQVKDNDWVEEDDTTKTPFTPHNATKDETWNPLYKVTWEYPDPTDPTKPKKDEDALSPDDKLTPPDDAPEVIKWVNKEDPEDVVDPGNPPKATKDDVTYVPVFTITWDDPTDTTDPVKVEVPYNSNPKTENVKKPDNLPEDVKDNDWSKPEDATNTPFTPHNATQDETWNPLFKITWKPNNNKDADKVETVKPNETPVYGENPTKSGSTFKTWDPTPYPATQDQIYNAKYTSNSSGGGGGGGGGSSTSTIPITWVVDGKKTVTNVPKGDTPVYPNGTPTKDGMVFDGWTPEIVPATKATTYTAVFRDPSKLPSTPVSPSDNGIANWLECGEHIIYYRGYPDGTIKPHGNITRNETAMILYRLLKNKNVPITASFSDVPDNEWYTDAVLTLASLGIITGYEDGTFRPIEPIRRAEFTAMCVRFVEATDAQYSFTDVLPGYWAYTEIMTAAHNGWITGYVDGSFRPEALIERCEAAAIVNRMLGRVADRSYIDAHENQLIHFPDLLKEWYYEDMIEGTNAHSYDVINGKETWTSMYDK